MKIIKYKFQTAEINVGTKESPRVEPILLDKTIRCSDVDLDVNKEIAKAEAYNGEYVIEIDDAVEEPVTPTSEERLAALEAAMLEMMGVTTDG